MDRNNIRFRVINGEVESPATDQENNYREDVNVSSTSKVADDEDVLGPVHTIPFLNKNGSV